MNKQLSNAIEILNELIDKAILKGDKKEYQRLQKLHKQLIYGENN